MKIIHTTYNSSSLLLFFNGWGMDERLLPLADGMDVMMLYAYHQNGGLPMDIIRSYKTVYVVAWSMGVWAAENILRGNSINPEKCVAINGTPFPVHPTLGIPPAIFKGTLDRLDERGRNKFMMRTLGGVKAFQQLEMKEKLPERTLEDQKAELAWFWDNAVADYQPLLTWDKAILGTDDLIFPCENMKAYWSERADVVIFDMPHYPFEQLKKWKDIFRLPESGARGKDK